MPSTPLRLLLLPFAALGDEAALGVWARQLPQLLGSRLHGSVVTVAPLWRDAGSGRLIRAGAALPETVAVGEAEAVAADWVLTGAVSQADEGVKADLELRSVLPPTAAQHWSLTFPLAGAGAAFTQLLADVSERIGRPLAAADVTAFEPLWPLLCDLEVEAELQAAGVAALTQPSAAWSHLRLAFRQNSAPWASERLAARRLLLQRLAPELLAAFDADGPKAPIAPTDLSTDEVLQLLGIAGDATPPSPLG